MKVPHKDEQLCDRIDQLQKIDRDMEEVVMVPVWIDTDGHRAATMVPTTTVMEVAELARAIAMEVIGK